MKKCALLALLLGGAAGGWAWEPRLPERAPMALPGGALIRLWESLPPAERESAVIAQVQQGNVPRWWRKFVDVTAGPATLHVAPDYVAVGSDEDFIRMPLTPNAAQHLADALDCTLPTPKIVDAIFQAAPLKLEPQPLPPGPEMTTLSQFARHHLLIEAAIRTTVPAHPAGTLTVGQKKDVVLTPRLAGARGHVAIYGWHRADGTPIQPLFLGHADSWVDYSHGVRLVAREVGWGSGTRRLDDLLADERWWTLFSDEGPCAPLRAEAVAPCVPEFAGERWETRFFAGGVRALIGRPTASVADQPTQLVIYAVPAGNTIEQTLGRALRADDDWHFDIQHIAAQARWLRAHGRPNLVLAVVAPERGSWVTWTREMPEVGAKLGVLLDGLRRAVPGARLTLASHSAGGSATFSLLDALERMPEDVERVALLDSDYRYDAARGHAAKLAEWLRGGDRRTLVVSAYEDFRARLDGKPFVTEQGGTWGRSQAMKTDLAALLGDFTERHDGPLADCRGAGGRAIFLLRRNPEAAIWHTRLVELNGFILALLAGTSDEGHGYGYLAPRVYGEFVAR